MDEEWCGGWRQREDEKEKNEAQTSDEDCSVGSGSGDKSQDSSYDHEFMLHGVLMSDRSCDPDLVNGIGQLPGLVTTAVCVQMNRCQGILESEKAPQTSAIPCGFDQDSSQMMICCPQEKVSDEIETTQAPRYPHPERGGARDCEDKHELCSRWKSEGGCQLDKEVTLSEADPWNSMIISKQLFDFMQITCISTCGWCGNKGCVDEHANCVKWARNGMCVLNPFFMAHTCRFTSHFQDIFLRIFSDVNKYFQGELWYLWFSFYRQHGGARGGGDDCHFVTLRIIHS